LHPSLSVYPFNYQCCDSPLEYDANKEPVTMNLDPNAVREASLLIKRFVISKAENSEDVRTIIYYSDSSV